MTDETTTALLIQLDAEERSALREAAGRQGDGAWAWEAGAARQLIREALIARGALDPTTEKAPRR